MMIKNIKQNKDLMYFVNNAPYKFLKSLTLILSSFVIIWYLANYTTKEFLGQFQFILATMGVLAIFSYSGIKVAILQSVARKYDFSLIKGTKFSLKFSLIGSFLILLLSAYYYIIVNDINMALSFGVTSILFPFFNTLDNFSMYLSGKMRFKEELLYYLIIKIILILSIFLTLWVFGFKIIFFILSYLLSQIIVYYYYFDKCKKEIKDNKIDFNLIRYGGFLTKINGIMQVANHFDRFLIGFLLSPSMLAIYAIGIMIPEKLKAIINPIFAIFFPTFSSDEIKLNKSKIFLIIIFSFIIFIITILLLPFFLKILFPKYPESIKYGLVFSSVILLFPLNIIFGIYFQSKKYLKGIKNPILFSRAFVILFSIPSILLFNLMGAIIIRIIGQFINLIINLYYYIGEDYENY